MSREFFVAHGVRPYHYLCFLVEDCYMAGCSCVQHPFFYAELRAVALYHSIVWRSPLASVVCGS